MTAKVFDKVVVITDRVVLDRQLQATIFQFDHEPGVVEKVEGTSAQLAEALESSTSKIIVSTLQKFPFVLERIGDLSDKRFAVVVDEAHSSQSGEAAKALRAALGSAEPVEDEDRDAEPDEVGEMTAALIERSARERGPQPNLSYFAFTATPTNRTLHVFGNREAGDLRPFHTYSMRQAIEEGFILDVLRRFMPYRVLWKVAAKLDEDPDVERRKAATEIVRFVSAQPQTLEEKAKVIVEHFRSATLKLIGGRAKAMVVTASRELAVRTHFALEAYIRSQGYTDCEPLVAFSGTVELDGEPWTEARINDFGEKQLAERFAEDGYRILTVAEKYQTGFDQPLLHTMYVDKQVSGLRAVQTLSRLNRTHPQKDDTFVLDFVNSAEEIRAAFKPWYEETRALPTDPNELYSARDALLAFGSFARRRRRHSRPRCSGPGREPTPSSTPISSRQRPGLRRSTSSAGGSSTPRRRSSASSIPSSPRPSASLTRGWSGPTCTRARCSGCFRASAARVSISATPSSSRISGSRRVPRRTAASRERQSPWVPRTHRWPW